MNFDMDPMTVPTASASLQPAERASKLLSYFALIKSRQTILLLATGVFAYVLSVSGRLNGWLIALFGLALFLSISGCTVLNMVIDRDIDAQMSRTRWRPLPAGRLSVSEAAIFGAVLSVLGLGLSFGLSWQAGVVIAAGFVFDLGVYTLWLKRRSPLSIIFGGIAGGMPALAGRVMALGRVDLIGLLLVLSIVLWIPSHIVTLAIKHRHDYCLAGVPVWPNTYGEMTSRRLIALANLLNAGVLLACGVLLHVRPVAMGLLAASALAMVVLAVAGILRPTERSTWVLFKFASVYMLLSFLFITFGAIL